MHDEFPSKLALSTTVRVEEMRSGEEVSAMVRLHGIGWGAKRIAQEFGCARNTVRRYLAKAVWCRIASQSVERHLTVWTIGFGSGFSAMKATRTSFARSWRASMGL